MIILLQTDIICLMNQKTKGKLVRMKRVTERFLRYVKVDTTCAEERDSVPSTLCQFDLSRLLARELEEMGMQNVYVDEHAYVYADLAASAGHENAPSIALNAHLDTIPDFPGAGVAPQVIRDYDGGEVALGDSGRILSPKDFPNLSTFAGRTLITTDGNTVLGADDKAGVAEIMQACEEIITEGIPHGRIAVCFSPDEEIGHGASLMDLERVNADYGFTVDGGAPGELNFETFNAAAARIEVNGFNIHPGSAKGKMINAGTVAMEINSMLPSGEVPEKTEKYEGFFHLTDMSGTVEKATLSYIVRDHDAVFLEQRKNTLRLIEKLINEKYGAGTMVLTITDQYRNMADLVKTRPEIMERAKSAIVRAGAVPDIKPIRGGTDGSQLSYRGLICPNLSTGGYAAHGPYEHITEEDLEICKNIVKYIVTDE